MTTITIELNDKQVALLNALKDQEGAEASDVVGSALEALASARLGEGDPLTPEQIAAIEEGLAAIERGDVVPHEQVVADIRAKFGR